MNDEGEGGDDVDNTSHDVGAMRDEADESNRSNAKVGAAGSSIRL